MVCTVTGTGLLSGLFPAADFVPGPTLPEVYPHAGFGEIVVTVLVWSVGGVGSTRMAARTSMAPLTARPVIMNEMPTLLFNALPAQAVVTPQTTGAEAGSMSSTSTELLDGAAPARQNTRVRAPVVAGTTGAAYRYDA